MLQTWVCLAISNWIRLTQKVCTGLSLWKSFHYLILNTDLMQNHSYYPPIACKLQIKKEIYVTLVFHEIRARSHHCCRSCSVVFPKVSLSWRTSIWQDFSNILEKVWIWSLDVEGFSNFHTCFSFAIWKCRTMTTWF